MVLHFVVVLLASHAALVFGDGLGISQLTVMLSESKHGLSSWKLTVAAAADEFKNTPRHDKENTEPADADAYLKMVFALRADDAETVMEILAEGMDANATYVNSTIHGRPLTEGSTLLHWAAVYGAAECIPVLLDHGAEIDTVTDTHFTPLHAASQSGHLMAVKILVFNDAVVDALSETGNTPLHEAANRGYTSIVEFLIEAGANVNRMNEHGITALEFAAQSGHLAVVEILIANEADVSHQDVFGFSPLHMAAIQGFTTIVETLVSAGADLEIKNDDEHTPLHCASSYGHLDASKVLVKAGANRSAATEEGMTPFDVMCDDASPECNWKTEKALGKLLAV